MPAQQRTEKMRRRTEVRDSRGGGAATPLAASEQAPGSGSKQVEFGVRAGSTQPGGHWLKIPNLDEVF